MHWTIQIKVIHLSGETAHSHCLKSDTLLLNKLVVYPENIQDLQPGKQQYNLQCTL